MSFTIDGITANTVEDFQETVEAINLFKKHVWFTGARNARCAIKRNSKNSYDISFVGCMDGTLQVCSSMKETGGEQIKLANDFRVLLNSNGTNMYFYINSICFRLILKNEEKKK